MIGRRAGTISCSPRNSGLRSQHVRRSLRAIAKKAGLEERTPHELRHTHANLLLARGTPIKVVSERLGQRDVTTTLEVYQHRFPV